MGVLALVEVDPRTARDLEDLGDVRRCAEGPDMDRVLQLVRDRLDVVVVGRGVKNPVQIVQRAHRLGRDIGVVVLLEDAHESARIGNAIKTAPFVGADVTCLDVSSTDPVAAVRVAAERTRNRRLQRSVYDGLNAQIAASSTKESPRAADGAAAALLDFAPVGIVALDASGRIVSANREVLRLLGAKERDLLGRELAQLRSDAPGEPFVAVPCSESDPPIVSFRGDHGRERLLEVRVAPIGEDRGHTFVALTDVTQRVLARREADTARRALETTLRSIGDAVVTTDTDGRVTMMNPVAERLTGWSESDARGRVLDDVFRILDERTREPVESPVRKVLHDGVVVELANHTVLVARDGSEQSIDDSAAPIRDAEGKVYGVVLVFRSVAEEKRAALRRAIVAETTAALAATLDYRDALRSLAVTLVPRFGDWCVVDLAREDADVTELVAVVHRDPRIAELGRRMRTERPPGDTDPLSPRMVLQTGKSVFLPDVSRPFLDGRGVEEDRIRRLESLGIGSIVMVPLAGRDRLLGALTLAHAESGRKYTEADCAFLDDFARRVGVAIDNVRLFAAERRARAEADAANRTKDEFLATVSHELRTPLNAILGWARMLATGMLTSDRHGSALDAIERNAAAMAQLIEDLLDVSRIISGKLRLEPDWIDPVHVVEAALDAVRPTAAMKEIELRASLDAGAATIRADPHRLQQIVWNLVSNAVKFTSKGGHVDVVLRRADSKIELVVADTGKGIPPSFLAHVFDPFRQADGTSTRVHGGLGLGLAITRHLVELHGGTIEAQSDGEGRGATFTVTLPVSAVRADRIGRERNELGAALRAASVPDLTGVHVLAVDDDPDSRLVIQHSLELAGARVVTAASAREAMDTFGREIPDVVVADIGMPEQDGYALMAMIRALSAEQGGTVPAAALTAFTRADDRKKVLASGFTLHLAKPVEPSELATVVATLARMSRRSQEK